jgi:Leucine-rich repeat (LRR) protein
VHDSLNLIVFSWNHLLIVLSIALSPIYCANCRYFNSDIYGKSCELSNVNYVQENGIFEITGEIDTNIQYMVIQPGSIMNYFPRRIFEAFPNLKVLILNDVQLKDIKEGTFSDCNQLVTLVLSSNLIQRVPSKAFQSCPTLIEVNLNLNQIDIVADDAFDGLSNLRVLQLGGNKINTMNQRMLQPLSSLLGLNLMFNSLTALPQNLFQYSSKLRFLWLQDNFIEQLPATIFDNLVDLETLDVSSNIIGSLPTAIFTRLTKLETLGLNNNLLVNIDRLLFSTLTSLKSLDLSTNKITEIQKETFRFLRALNMLDLSFNYLTELDKDLFANNANLLILNLIQNYLRVGLGDIVLVPRQFDPSFLRPLVNLEEIYIHYNQLQEVWNNTFATNTKLEIVSFWGNNIDAIHSALFSTTPLIKELYFIDNFITKIDRNLLTVLPNLELLALGGNDCINENFFTINATTRSSLGGCFFNYDGMRDTTPAPPDTTLGASEVYVSTFLLAIVSFATILFK